MQETRPRHSLEYVILSHLMRVTVEEDFYFAKIKDIYTMNWCIKGAN